MSGPSDVGIRNRGRATTSQRVTSPALSATASLSATALGSANLSTAIPVLDAMPGPTSPDVSIQTSFCPLPQLTVHDMEAAVADRFGFEAAEVP